MDNMTPISPTIDATHVELTDALRAIGNASEMACWASYIMASMVEDTGKPIADLTVGELISLIDRHDARIRKAFSPQMVEPETDPSPKSFGTA